MEFVLLRCLDHETDSRWGKHIHMHVHLVYAMETRVGCCVMGTTQVWRRHSVSHMILGNLETVGFKGSLRFEIFIEIQGCGSMGRVFLKVPSEYLEWSINQKHKVFYWTRHGDFVVGSSIFDFLSGFLNLEEQYFVFIVHRSNEVGNGLNDVIDYSF